MHIVRGWRRIILGTRLILKTIVMMMMIIIIIIVQFRDDRIA